MSNFLKTAFAAAVFVGMCDSARALELYSPMSPEVTGLTPVVSEQPLAPFQAKRFIEASAKFGIARLDQGRLIALPFGEEVDWVMLDQRISAEIEPISVKGYLQNVPEIPMYGHDTSNKVDEIRLTAQDQNLDYVIVYALPCTEKKTRVAEAKIIDIYSGEILGQVTAEPSEIEFNIGILADRVGEMIEIYTRQTSNLET